jgi:putative FmdB family regulatory protein
MPIYEYQCRTCKKKFETLVFRASEEVACPKCHGTDTHKLMSTFSHKSGAKFSSSKGESCGSCHSGSCHSCKH